MPDFTPDERELVRPHFDAAYYLAKNPDLAEIGVDALDHFMASGWREGRDPNPWFSVKDYLSLNHDIDDLQLNPFVHWLRSGEKEGRQRRIDLGFRYEVLRDAPSLEARLELGRADPSVCDGEGDLIEAIARLGATRLFITVSHDEFVGRLGGVQTCLQLESEALRADGWSHLHIYPAIPLYVTVFEDHNPSLGLVINGEVAGIWPADQIAMHLALMLQRGDLQTTRFAIHSLLGHNVEALTGILLNAGARRGFFWLHDQTSLCASYALLRNDVEYCGAPPPESAACGVCIYGLRRQVQIAEHAALFRTFDLTVVAPSRAMHDHWISKAPYEFTSSCVHPHLRLRPRDGAQTAYSGKLRIAFLGFPYPHKGWPIFCELAQAYAGEEYEFLHLAHESRDHPDIAHIPLSAGGGEVSDLVRALGVDVAMILSICPETFSFTAHEALAGGAAIVAFADSCAVAQLVNDTGQGKVVASEAGLKALFDTGEIRSLARRLRQPGAYDLVYSRMTADLLEPAR